MLDDAWLFVRRLLLTHARLGGVAAVLVPQEPRAAVQSLRSPDAVSGPRCQRPLRLLLRMCTGVA
eukprot:COSAG01_NODE_4321_length_5134_cov_3.912612_2_plen_65_part_00